MQHIVVRAHGQLDATWQEWLFGLKITHLDAGVTVIEGNLPDHAAIYGLIARLRDLGLNLISFQCEGVEQKLDR